MSTFFESKRPTLGRESKVRSKTRANSRRVRNFRARAPRAPRASSLLRVADAERKILGRCNPMEISRG
jgi:hypothetical protein